MRITGLCRQRGTFLCIPHPTIPSAFDCPFSIHLLSTAATYCSVWSKFTLSLFFLTVSALPDGIFVRTLQKIRLQTYLKLIPLFLHRLFCESFQHCRLNCEKCYTSNWTRRSRLPYPLPPSSPIRNSLFLQKYSEKA